ncbi:hypothetical protein [Baaleninema sp.]
MDERFEFDRATLFESAIERRGINRTTVEVRSRRRSGNKRSMAYRVRGRI